MSPASEPEPPEDGWPDFSAYVPELDWITEAHSYAMSQMAAAALNLRRDDEVKPALQLAYDEAYAGVIRRRFIERAQLSILDSLNGRPSGIPGIEPCDPWFEAYEDEDGKVSIRAIVPPTYLGDIE